MPEIALNGLLLDYPFSGTATYTRNLVQHLPEAAPDLDFRLFARTAGISAAGVKEERLSTPLARLNRGQGVGARLDKLSWEILALPAAAALRGDALIHSLYFAAPPLATAPLVVTIHDLIPLVLAGYHRTRQSALYSRFMAWTARRAAAIITVSHHSKNDIVRVLKVPEERVRVTHEAVDGRFAPDRAPGEGERLRGAYGLPERFLLYTGGAERRKNLELLVRAYRRVAERMRERGVRLVIVARFPRPDRLYPDVPGLVRELGLEGDVILIPEVAEEDKPGLYRAALGFCFPSRYEGFGFTPLEAMASGLPAIVSDAASLPEVVGDGALTLSPDDEGAWAEAMLELVDSARLAEELRARGLKRARAFCWRRTAGETAAVYREVLGR